MKDRIRASSLCLMATAFVFGATAWSLHERQGSWSLLSISTAVYALLVYIVMGVLAIYFRRWAWQASIGIFGLNVLIGVLSLSSVVGWLLLLLAAVGIWASLSIGTKAVLQPTNNGAA